ncbi:helix-turn-helix domain-containing protein [Hymenobacter mucosus]|uniref:Transcriptional regulator, AraC family n=1 Tax=Hymenobacter mucosus TaxID=1411120 RepID=A0A239BGC0_9BACT|nr:helix-turn-helix domain-containing protein [Hymenobacter mucosus]SNS06836.1 transcriptional regulator, AraC family [Hymenobacter mucosus]
MSNTSPADSSLEQLPALVVSGLCQVYTRQQFGTRALAYGRRDYYKISLTTGRGRYNYATRGVLIEQPALVFSNPLIPYSWEPLSEEQGGYLCLFTEGFMAESDPAVRLQESPLFRLGSDPIYLVDAAQYAALSQLFEQMVQQLQAGAAYRPQVVRQCLHQVLDYALHLPPPTTYYQHPNAAARVASLFQELLNRQFPIASPTHTLQLRTPGDFARYLSVHVNHLNRAVRECTGQTTSGLIAERVVHEAKALLATTEWSTADIAYALGFAYPTYFNNFFKKHTGMTPSAVRARSGPSAERTA